MGFIGILKKKLIDMACFDGVDAIINLSGASIFRIWTKKNKKIILDSRVESLMFLKNIILRNNINIESIVSASGISSYPSSYEKEFNENEIKKNDYFLSNVIEKWEAAANSFSDVAKNVSVIRVGLVLSKKAGVLKKTLYPMVFGFGVYFGSGKQWQSWIHIQDISRIFIYAITTKLNGIYNGVSPNPISNYRFIKVVSEIKGNVFFLISVPKFFFKLIFGEMHKILFESQKISSKKIQSTGFKFFYEEIESSIKNNIK